MLEKLNLKKVFSDHFNTLVDYRTKQLSCSDIFVYFILPLLLALVLALFRCKISKEIAGVFITMLSIFCPLLFNFQLLIYGLIERKENPTLPKPKGDLRKQLLSETYYNISFSILLSLLSIIFLFVFYFDPNRSFPLPAFVSSAIGLMTVNVNSFLTVIGYYLIISFFIVLFMILKRVHVLLTKDIF